MKKKGIQKSLRVLCMLLCFFAMTAVRVSAEEAHGQGQKGSLSVVMQNRKTNTKIPGGEVALYQVAGITSKETEIQYAFTNGFENCGLKLDNLEDDLARLTEGPAGNSAQEALVLRLRDQADCLAARIDELEAQADSLDNRI